MVKKSIVEAKFKRDKLIVEHTFLWIEIPIKEKFIIESMVSFDDNEQPIVCFLESIDYAWIISDTRLIVLTDGKTNCYSYTDIKKVELSDLFNRKSTKLENNTLTIILNNSNSFKIKVELKTWSTLYNCLRFVINSYNR